MQERNNTPCKTIVRSGICRMLSQETGNMLILFFKCSYRFLSVLIIWQNKNKHTESLVPKHRQKQYTEILVPKHPRKAYNKCPKARTNKITALGLLRGSSLYLRRGVPRGE